MKPAVKIVSRAHSPRRRRVRVSTRKSAPPMDVRTKAFLVGSGVALLSMGGLAAVGVRDGRLLLTGLLVAVAGPMGLTIARLRIYMPRAHSVRVRELRNVPLGALLGVPVFFLWKMFPAMYRALEAVVWRPTEFAGGAYLESVQIALDAAGGYFLGLVLGALLVGAQASVWVVPAYLLAKGVTRPVEDEVEAFYRQKIRQSTRQLVGRASPVTKFKVGGELAATKVQLRVYGTVLSLFAGLVVMTILAWVMPLL